MKKLTLLLVALVSLLMPARAQELPAVPLDPNVKTGVLPNGLTYYIRHNEWPEKRVDFYIAQKVGSMQEEDNQRGLAHFLEHMCFNGTTHFPGNALIQYLERIGVKFGENLNAYTAFDETVYNINNVNVEIEGAVDSCLLILHDWSHDLLLEGKEIDKERDVINEEWRVRRSAMMRMQERAFATLFEGSRYAARMPIGTMEVVMNFPHDVLRQYYKTWYRPDLQGIVIVGDVDVAQMEEKIKAVFADIQAPAPDAVKREFHPVAHNQEPLVAIEKDKEQPASYAMMLFKMPAMPREMRGAMQFYAQNFVWEAVGSMLNQRLAELTMQANPDFVQASVSHGEYMVAKTMDALNATVVLKDGEYIDGLKAVYRELLRAKRFGFTQAEYDRCCQEVLSAYEAAYAKRDKVQNSSYVNEYVRHFLDGVPAPGIEWEYETMKKLLPAIPIEAINQTIAQLPETGRAVVYFMPEKDGMDYPTKASILQAISEVDAETIEGYVEEVNTDPLVALTDSTATVTSVKPGVYDSQVVTLSNGIRVHMLPTDYAPNQISFYATSWGGTSLYPNSDYLLSSNLGMVTLGGWGNFSMTQLQKRLSGIQASASPFISDRSEGVRGSCVKKDFETMLQLVYLCFTAPRRDDEAYQGYLTRIKAVLANNDLDPKSALADSVARVLYDNNVRAVRLRAADVDRLDYDRIMQIYGERFANAGDFDYYLVGDFKVDSIAPLVAKYLGGLPVVKGREKYKKIDKQMASGLHTCIFDKAQDTPNAVVNFIYHAKMKNNLRNGLITSMLEQAMDMLFTETVREDEGGSYGVPVSAGLSDYPRPLASVQIQLATSPDKMQRMMEVIEEGVQKIAAEGCSEENLQKIKEYMLRSHAENLKKNGFWMNSLISKTRMKEDQVKDYEKTVKSITVKDIQKMAKTILLSGNRTIVGMKTPEE